MTLLSESSTYYYMKHDFVGLTIIAVSAFLIGLFLGWLLWRSQRKIYLAAKKTNDELVEVQTLLQKDLENTPSL